MALTDAIGISCKALGMAADVYFAKDRTKYDNNEIEPHKTGENDLKISEALANCNNLDDLTMLWNSLEQTEQNRFKPLFYQQQQVSQQSMSQQPVMSAQRPATIPTVGKGRSVSHAASKVKTLDDIRALAKNFKDVDDAY
jgi:hypothetical protein